jgi:hypothetical protein
MRDNGRFIKGQHYSPKTEFKKGQIRPSGMLGKHHSEETKRKMREDGRKGRKPWNKGIPTTQECKRRRFKSNKEYWDKIGRVTPERELIKCRKEYLEWRKMVFARDGYRCVICGKTGGEINAHHIKSFKDYPELRVEVSNGITLCRSCHYIGKKGIPLFFINRR